MRFTPINIIANCAFDQFGCIMSPVIKGNQWLNPAKMAKTAPILRT